MLVEDVKACSGILGKDLEMQWDLFVEHPNAQSAADRLHGIRDLT